MFRNAHRVWFVAAILVLSVFGREALAQKKNQTKNQDQKPAESSASSATNGDDFYQFVNMTNRFSDDQISWAFGDRGTFTSFAQAKSAAAKMGGGGRIYFKIRDPRFTYGNKPKEYKDFIEYTHNNSGWHGNTTQVDEFVIPITIELFEADGSSKKVGITESRAALFEAFRKNAPKEFQSCVIGTDRIVSPHKADFQKGKANGNYFDKYVDEIWAMYATEKQTPGGWIGKVVDGKLIFSKAGHKDYVLTKKPSTSDILLGQNEMGKSADWCSAFNRHVAADPGDWRNVSAYYQTEPYNYYAKFFHEHSLRGLSYGFCYDDFNQQAAYFEGHHPKHLVVTIYWDTPPK